jgi:parallel beta-helix repeat protein
MRSTKRTLRGSAPALLVCAVALALAAPNPAWAKKPNVAASGPDPTSVSACGTLSGNNVIYQLTANITSAATTTCITLSGSYSALDLHGFTIAGPGGSSNGSGIAVTGNYNLIEGLNGSVQGFKVGVTDTATGTVGDDINLRNNVTGLYTQSSHFNRWTNMEVAGNTGNGIYIYDCDDGCTVTDFFVHDNGLNGVLVVDSEYVKLDLFTATSNGADGVHIGLPCNLGGGCKHDLGIRVVDGYAGIADGTDPLGPNGNFGVALDLSEAKAQDQVTVVRASGNMIDLFDETANCGSNPFNLWYNNQYDLSKAGSTVSPTCILASIPLI